MISAQPGLVPQEKGQLTCAQIWACMVFIDYATNYMFIALMRNLSAELTLAAKGEFELRCALCRILVLHYHADNGHFAEPVYIKNCKSKHQ